MYRRLADTFDAANEDRLGPEHAPFVRGLALNRHQARSVADFYEERARAERQLKEEEDVGEITPETQQQIDELNDVAGLMTAVRQAEPKTLNGRRKFEYQPYVVGLAREALGVEPLDDNPSPFNDEDLPEPLKEVLSEFAANKTKRAILAERVPIRKDEQSEDEYQAVLDVWEAGRKADERWLDADRESPIVRAAIDAAFRTSKMRDILNRERRGEADRIKRPSRPRDLDRWRRQVTVAREGLRKFRGG
jgi:hypothetical protein